MAIAVDLASWAVYNATAVTRGGAATGGTFNPAASWLYTHTPVGTPTAVGLLVVTSSLNSAPTSATYGGTTILALLKPTVFMLHHKITASIILPITA